MLEAISPRQRLRTVRRSMLRRFAARRRQTEEDWIGWIKRSTHEAEAAAEAAGCKCWTSQYLATKWLWAGKVSCMGGLRPESWAYILTRWRDSRWRADNGPGTDSFSNRPLRSRPGRWSRWDNELATFCETNGLGEWSAQALEPETWMELKQDFLNYVLG